MILWYLLKPEDQEKLAGFYQHNFKKTLRPPRRDGKDIECEVKIEDLEEIGKLMRQKPGDVGGRR